MATYHDVEYDSRRRREFGRLVEAWEAARRHGLHITLALFSERLQRLGGYIDSAGCWQLYQDTDGKTITVLPAVNNLEGEL